MQRPPHNPARGEATVKRHDGTDAPLGVDMRNVARIQFRLMPSGKPVALELPLTITEDEGFALVEAVVRAVRQLEHERAQPARLVVPR